MFSKVGTARSPSTSPSWNIWSLLRRFRYSLTSIKEPTPAREQTVSLIHNYKYSISVRQSLEIKRATYYACKDAKSYSFIPSLSPCMIHFQSITYQYNYELLLVGVAPLRALVYTRLMIKYTCTSSQLN